MRSSLEVLTFVRPSYDITVSAKAEAELTDVPTINPAQIRPNLRSERVAVIQMALAYVTGVRGLPRGHFDLKTRDAYAKFQRDVGVYPADGIPEINSLTRLASETLLFKAEA
jgi:peptidoglycan hydrolase-like protein with peptidoglycan-binding domain